MYCLIYMSAVLPIYYYQNYKNIIVDPEVYYLLFFFSHYIVVYFTIIATKNFVGHIQGLLNLSLHDENFFVYCVIMVLKCTSASSSHDHLMPRSGTHCYALLEIVHCRISQLLKTNLHFLSLKVKA